MIPVKLESSNYNLSYTFHHFHDTTFAESWELREILNPIIWSFFAD